MPVNRYAFFLFFLWLSLSATAQPDSSFLLTPERLTKDDIKGNNLSSDATKVISASRWTADLTDQPFSLWVVTAEDILRYGFVTLGDVLRAAPGIRVSQPGNAVEGETFIMRGLAGNRYVKILVNDVPIQPSVMPGMPIGAQLPIRQAERIEVMYGAAGTLYGAGACAGVVNIILKETERPVFTQADLSFSLNYASMDLMFGGKLGSDKNILRYSLYGSNTVREKVDIYDDLSLYSLDQYVPFDLGPGIYRFNPNYLPSYETDPEHAKLSQLTQESRLFGLNLAWRGWHFNYNRMGRFEPNMLGMSPLALSYANPSNRLAEKQQVFSLSFQRKKRHRSVRNALTVSNYAISGISSSTYLFDRASMAQYRAWQAAGNSGFNLQDSAYNLYARGERYSIANGLDFRLESRFRFQLQRHLFWDVGVLLDAPATGVALWNYNRTPQINDVFIVNGNDGIGSPVYPNFDSKSNSNLFSQLSWSGRKLQATASAGLVYDVFVITPVEPVFRGGIQYKIDSSWSLRANMSTDVSLACPYHYGLSYSYDKAEGKMTNPFYSNPFLRNTEKFKSAEFALRRGNSDGLSTEAVFFWQHADNLIRNGIFQDYYVDNFQTPEYDSLTLGYFGFYNTPGRAMNLLGGQILLKRENKEGFNFVTGERRTRISSRTEFFIQYSRGKEWFGYGLPATKDILNYPRWQTQFRTFFKLNEKLELMLSSNRQSAVLSKAVVYKDYYQLPDRSLKHATFRSWDMQLRGFLSKQFTVYVFIQNVFDRNIYGIDATGTPDDLIYNPQPGRFVRLGVNYSMN